MATACWAGPQSCAPRGSVGLRQNSRRSHDAALQRLHRARAARYVASPASFTKRWGCRRSERSVIQTSAKGNRRRSSSFCASASSQPGYSKRLSPPPCVAHAPSRSRAIPVSTSASRIWKGPSWVGIIDRLSPYNQSLPSRSRAPIEDRHVATRGEDQTVTGRRKTPRANSALDGNLRELVRPTRTHLVNPRPRGHEQERLFRPVQRNALGGPAVCRTDREPTASKARGAHSLGSERTDPFRFVLKRVLPVSLTGLGHGRVASNPQPSEAVKEPEAIAGNYEQEIRFTAEAYIGETADRVCSTSLPSAGPSPSCRAERGASTPSCTNGLLGGSVGQAPLPGDGVATVELLSRKIITEALFAPLDFSGTWGPCGVRTP